MPLQTASQIVWSTISKSSSISRLRHTLLQLSRSGPRPLFFSGYSIAADCAVWQCMLLSLGPIHLLVFLWCDRSRAASCLSLSCCFLDGSGCSPASWIWWCHLQQSSCRYRSSPFRANARFVCQSSLCLSPLLIQIDSIAEQNFALKYHSIFCRSANLFVLGLFGSSHWSSMKLGSIHCSCDSSLTSPFDFIMIYLRMPGICLCKNPDSVVRWPPDQSGVFQILVAFWMRRSCRDRWGRLDCWSHFGDS